MKPHRKGDATEAAVIAELKQRNVPVSIPFGDNERYDIIIETPEGRPVRIQIKTAHYRDGILEIRGLSQHTNSEGNQYKRYRGDVDYFIGYNNELENIYLLSEEMVRSRISLRVDEPEQIHGNINWAEEYEFDELWPPEPGEEHRHARRALLRNALADLDALDIQAWSSSGNVPYQILVERDDGQLLRIRVRSISLQEDHLTLHASGGVKHDRIDYYLGYSHEQEQAYLVGSDEFNKSIKLRIRDTVQNRSTINWAEEYELESRSEMLK